MSLVADVADPRLAPGPRVRLRRAGLADAGRLAALSVQAAGRSGLSAEQMSTCIEHGGALYYEDESGPVSMLAWQESAAGWELQPFRTSTDQDDLGHSRWLMTQVEALAIRLNIPRLCLRLGTGNNEDYYRRLGYERESADSNLLVKRVGGTWQLRQTGSQA